MNLYGIQHLHFTSIGANSPSNKQKFFEIELSIAFFILLSEIFESQICHEKIRLCRGSFANNKLALVKRYSSSRPHFAASIISGTLMPAARILVNIAVYFSPNSFVVTLPSPASFAIFSKRYF